LSGRLAPEPVAANILANVSANIAANILANGSANTVANILANGSAKGHCGPCHVEEAVAAQVASVS
jgi:hypothetical protein